MDGEQLADFFISRELPDHVVDAFLEEGVEGCDIVGDYRFAGDDVEHIVWTFTLLGTENEVEPQLSRTPSERARRLDRRRRASGVALGCGR